MTKIFCYNHFLILNLRMQYKEIFRFNVFSGKKGSMYPNENLIENKLFFFHFFP